MTGLLLVAHGSRRAESNAEVEELARRLGERAGERYSLVGHAFLEFASPSLAEAIESCVRRGVGHLVVLPYFLAAGHHVVRDIPECVAAKRRAHPHLSVVIVPYLGAAGGLVEVLLSLIPGEPPIEEAEA